MEKNFKRKLDTLIQALYDNGITEITVSSKNDFAVNLDKFIKAQLLSTTVASTSYGKGLATTCVKYGGIIFNLS
jgi:hypothetical protein